MPRFFIRNEKTQTEQVLNFSQDAISIGRVSSCDIELAQKGVSRKHAEIVHENGNYFLIDLKSGNGTFLNGQRARSIEKHLLRPGDLIKIEDFEITFTLAEENEGTQIEEDTDTDIVEVKMIKKVLKALNKEAHPSLEVLNGAEEGRKVYFTEDLPELIVGRDPDCTLPIDAAVISRQHAKLVRKWGGIALIDLGSRNGSYVNNEKIDEKLLHDGDKILLGTIKLIYRNPQDVNLEAIGEEIARKKEEAALREAEIIEMTRQKEEAERRLREEEEKIAQEKADQERIEREKIEAEKAQQAAKDAEAAVAKQQTKQAKQATSRTVGLSGAEKLFISLAVLVLVAVVVVIIVIATK